MTTVVCSQCRANVGELEAVGGQLGGGVGECDFARELRFVPGTLQTERDVELSRVFSITGMNSGSTLKSSTFAVRRPGGAPAGPAGPGAPPPGGAGGPRRGAC